MSKSLSCQKSNRTENSKHSCEYIDECQTWENHIKIISNKIAKNVGTISYYTLNPAIVVCRTYSGVLLQCWHRSSPETREACGRNADSQKYQFSQLDKPDWPNTCPQTKSRSIDEVRVQPCEPWSPRLRTAPLDTETNSPLEQTEHG